MAAVDELKKLKAKHLEVHGTEFAPTGTVQGSRKDKKKAAPEKPAPQVVAQKRSSIDGPSRAMSSAEPSPPSSGDGMFSSSARGSTTVTPHVILALLKKSYSAFRAFRPSTVRAILQAAGSLVFSWRAP